MARVTSMRRTNLALSQELEDSRAIDPHDVWGAVDPMTPEQEAAVERSRQMAPRTLLDELGAPTLEEDDERYLWKDVRKAARRARLAAAREERALRRRAWWASKRESVALWTYLGTALLVIAWTAAVVK